MNWAKKSIEILWHLLFAFLFFLSIILYKERLFADASYYFFHTINQGWFQIEHGRIVLGISQFFTLIAYYLGFSLQWLTVLFSFSHELFYYTLFVLCYYRLKDHAAAIGILLTHLIGQLWLYYSPMLEICYGAALVFLVYSILKSGRYQNDLWFMLLLIAQWFAMTSHPENFLLIAFVFVYDCLKRGWQQRVHLSFLSLFLIAVLLEGLTLSSYELQNIQRPVNEGASMLNLLSIDYLSDLSALFFEYYPDLMLLLFLLLPLLILKRSFKLIFILLSSILLLIAAVNHSALAIEFERYYESMYNPLVFLVVFTWVYEFYTLKLNSRSLFLTLSLFAFLLASIRIAWIYDFGSPLRQNLNQMERLSDYAQSRKGDKFVIRKENFVKTYSRPTWAFPIEQLILSAIDGKENTVSLITDADRDYNNNSNYLNDSSFVFRRFELKPHGFLNPRFFQLRKGPYQPLNTTLALDSIQDLKSQLQLKLPKEDDTPIYCSGDTLWQLIDIQNQATSPLPSALESNVFLSYHWYSEDGEKIVWDGLRSPLEVDVIDRFQQEFRLAVPEEKGVYYLVPDLLVEGEMWFGLNQKYLLEVR